MVAERMLAAIAARASPTRRCHRARASAADAARPAASNLAAMSSRRPAARSRVSASPAAAAISAWASSNGASPRSLNGRTFLPGHFHRVLDRLDDQPTGDVEVSLGQTQQGEPRLRRPHVPVRLQERLLRTSEIAPSQPDQAELCQWPAELASHPRPQLDAGRGRLGLGLGGRSGEPEQLRAMYPAAPVDAAEGDAVPPPLHHLGPLPRPVVQRKSLSGADELAIHHSAGEGIDVPGHQHRRDLLEQRHSLGHPALEDADPAQAGASDHDRGHECPTARRAAPPARPLAWRLGSRRRRSVRNRGSSRPSRASAPPGWAPAAVRRDRASPGPTSSSRCRSAGTSRRKPPPPRRRPDRRPRGAGRARPPTSGWSARSRLRRRPPPHGSADRHRRPPGRSAPAGAPARRATHRDRAPPAHPEGSPASSLSHCDTGCHALRVSRSDEHPQREN